MLWLIQKKFYSNDNHLRLISMLNYMRKEYVEVNFNDIEKLKHIDYGTNNIVVCGGMKLAAIAKEMGWKPGTFVTEDFDYRKWVEMYGSSMLNHDIQVGKISEIEPKLTTFFIRPIEDSKYFAGKSMTKELFMRWRKEFIEKTKGKVNIEGVDVIISPVTSIYAEYRFFIAGGRIVASSQYKSGDSLFISDSVPQDCVDFVKTQISKWQPSDAFVIDIGSTKEGYKIVEFNNYTSSGFYACDIRSIIEGVERLNV